MEEGTRTLPGSQGHTLQPIAELLRQLVAHLRQNRTQLREEWARRITEANLLTAMTKEEIFAEATSVYDNYVEALETGTFEALQAYARGLSERIIPRGVETEEVIGIVLLLRDVLARSLFAKYQKDFALLNRILDAYEPAANRIANTVAVGFVQERERVIREQQEAIRVLSTPVLQVRERLLILPIIGVIVRWSPRGQPGRPIASLDVPSAELFCSAFTVALRILEPRAKNHGSNSRSA